MIESPELAGTHPMGAREKVALFNILGVIQGSRVLDAYAGSGALGIEALSRGAAEVVLVEQNPSAARVIRENLAKIGATEVARVENMPVERFMESLGQVKNPAKHFDLIIADPPYDDFRAENVAKLGELLAKNGVFSLSHPGKKAPELAGLTPIKTRSYARANISLYRHTF